MAKVMNVSQARVSPIQRGDLSHCEVRNPQAYVAALGEASVIVDFGDHKIILE